MSLGPKTNQESKFTKYIKSYDWYAKPVALTYNQQKAQKTLPGAICCLISFFLLSFFIISSLIKCLDPRYATFNHVVSRKLLDFNEPPEYKIGITEFNLLTSLESSNATVQKNINMYYSGVYV